MADNELHELFECLGKRSVLTDSQRTDLQRATFGLEKANLSKLRAALDEAEEDLQRRLEESGITLDEEEEVSVQELPSPGVTKQDEETSNKQRRTKKDPDAKTKRGHPKPAKARKQKKSKDEPETESKVDALLRILGNRSLITNEWAHQALKPGSGYKTKHTDPKDVAKEIGIAACTNTRFRKLPGPKPFRWTKNPSWRGSGPSPRRANGGSKPAKASTASKGESDEDSHTDPPINDPPVLAEPTEPMVDKIIEEEESTQLDQGPEAQEDDLEEPDTKETFLKPRSPGLPSEEELEEEAEEEPNLTAEGATKPSRTFQSAPVFKQSPSRAKAQTPIVPLTTEQWNQFLLDLITHLGGKEVRYETICRQAKPVSGSIRWDLKDFEGRYIERCLREALVRLKGSMVLFQEGQLISYPDATGRSPRKEAETGKPGKVEKEDNSTSKEKTEARRRTLGLQDLVEELLWEAGQAILIKELFEMVKGYGHTFKDAPYPERQFCAALKNPNRFCKRDGNKLDLLRR